MKCNKLTHIVFSYGQIISRKINKYFNNDWNDYIVTILYGISDWTINWSLLIMPAIREGKYFGSNISLWLAAHRLVLAAALNVSLCLPSF